MQVCISRISRTFGTLFLFGLLWFSPFNPALAEADFRKAVESVVMLQSEVPATARTADALGTQRQGSGVVIDDDGLVLTIGYLVMESDEITLTNYWGKSIPAGFVAYDHATGFGLVRALSPIGVDAIKLGSSSSLDDKSVALIVSLGDSRPATPVQVVSRRTFAGAWEYLLEDAIYTMPPHRGFGGAALINRDGELVGVGSLFVNDAMGLDAPTPGNMFVPIDLLKPILPELVAKGRRASSPDPWLGIYTRAQGGRLFVTRVAASGPAQKAGIKVGDIVMGVDGKRVTDMADFYRRVRNVGDAGSNVDLDLLPSGSQAFEIKQIVVKSLDRHDWLTKPVSH